jgi:transcriptional regulator GlxA family with amidase domain
VDQEDGGCARFASAVSYWLKQAFESRRRPCTGMHALLLASRYPAVQVEPDAIFVRDGRVWTSAGVTSGIDLALALI